MGRVALIFPPVVFSNFGRYYPSTAMLASFLIQNSVPCSQFDLNYILFRHLLDKTRLQAIAHTNGSQESEIWSDDRTLAEYAAAKCALRLHHLFFDTEGRAISRPAPPLAVLESLSHRYYFDASAHALLAHALLSDPRWVEISKFIESRVDLQEHIIGANIIGISVPMGPQLVWALAIAKRLSDLTDAWIVLGGPIITLMDDELSANLLSMHTYIDALVKYQGEQPLLELAKLAEEGRPISGSIVNVVTPRSLGNLGKRTVTVPKNLDSLPSGYYEDSQLQRLATPEIAIRQAEGCYWGRCAYCDYVELYPKSGPHYRPRSVALIADEMQRNSLKYGIRQFVLITESLPPKIGWDLAEEILSRGLKVEWASFAMVDRRFTDAILERMSASGCSTLYVGVETVVDRILKHVDKKATKEQTWLFFEACNKAKISLVVNLIPNLPTTTREEALNSLKEISDRLKGAAWINIFPFEATRSSQIGRSPTRYGLTIIPDDERTYQDAQAEFSANHLNVIDNAMTDDERIEVIDAYRRYSASLENRPQHPDISCPPNGDLIVSNDSEILLPPHDNLRPVVFAGTTGKITQFNQMWIPVLRSLAERGSVNRHLLRTMFNGFTEMFGDGFEDEIVEALQNSGAILQHGVPNINFAASSNVRLSNFESS